MAVLAIMVKPEFQLRGERTESGARLELAGELDLATVARVEQEVDKLLAGEPAELVVDLAGLTFVDSSGLRTLIALNQRSAREGWSLRLGRPSEQVFQVFHIGGADVNLPFSDGRDRG
jgi:anti-sigma B factor antagonist